jgi:hypothetical protein
MFFKNKFRFLIWEKTCYLCFSESAISFFFVAEYYSIVYIYHIFIHSSVYRHTSADFMTWLFVTTSTINMGVQVFLLYADLHSFEYIPMSGIEGWYGTSKF